VQFSEFSRVFGEWFAGLTNVDTTPSELGIGDLTHILRILRHQNLLSKKGVARVGPALIFN
jgi:hypothetical protein